MPPYTCQNHTPPESSRRQGQNLHTCPQTWIKCTHSLRVGNHKDSISSSIRRHPSSSHTHRRYANTITASAQVSTDMHQVHTPTEGRKKQGQHQHKFPQTCIKFTHSLRAGKHKNKIRKRFTNKEQN